MRALLRIRAFTAAIIFAVLISPVAFAEPQRLWVAGWGVYASGDKKIPIIEPFVAVGADDTKLPPEYKDLPGRTLYLLDDEHAADTAFVARINDEPGPCLPDVELAAWTDFDLDRFFLASTSPIAVAPTIQVPLNDTRVQAGISSFLRGKGLGRPDVLIARAVQVDLNGDGRQEVVVEARARRLDLLDYGQTEPDDFTIVTVGALTSTSYAVQDFRGYIEDGKATREFSTLVGLPDFKGDGHFQVAISYYGYEWAGVSIYEWSGSALTRVSEAYCGI